jgi:SH3-like domain-containing protein
MLIAGLLLYNFPGLSSPTTSKAQRQRAKIVVPKSGSETSTEFVQESTKSAKQVEVKPAVRKSEPEQTQKRPSSMAEQSAEKTELVASHSSVMEKPSQVISSHRNEAQAWESLPHKAKIRSLPSIHATVLQLIRRGTRLQVVGKKGAWLKLQLRNGSTGWIYHSLAQPEREPAEKPLTVLRGSNGTSEPFSAQSNITKKASLPGEVLSSMQNGSEVAQFYPE